MLYMKLENVYAHILVLVSICYFISGLLIFRNLLVILTSVIQNCLTVYALYSKILHALIST